MNNFLKTKKKHVSNGSQSTNGDTLVLQFLGYFDENHVDSNAVSVNIYLMSNQNQPVFHKNLFPSQLLFEFFRKKPKNVLFSLQYH